MLSLQRALRTLTTDYKCLKSQVQDFPFLLDKAITEAKQEVSEQAPGTVRSTRSQQCTQLDLLSDLCGDQRGEQNQPGAAAQIQARDEPEEEMSRRACSTQRWEPLRSLLTHCICS